MDGERRRCSNCDLQCVGRLCVVCSARRHCRCCLRRLPDSCFLDGNVNECETCVKRNHDRGLFTKRDALNGAAVEITFDTTQSNDSYEGLFDHLRETISTAVRQQMELNGSIRVHFTTRAVFQRSALNEFGSEDVSHIVAHFHHPSVVVTEAQPLDLDAVVAHFRQRVEDFSRYGSGYILERIDHLSASFVQFRPLGAGTFVTTPTWIKNKQAVINVKNPGDDKCFVWSVLACLREAKHNPDRRQNYERYERDLNLTGLTFPLPIKDIPKFEAQNQTIAIHCIAADSKDKTFSILYLSPQAHQRRHTITLLLLDHPTDSGKKHYTYVKNLSRLIAGRSKRNSYSHVCLSCLQVFTSERVLKQHERCCLAHRPQQIVYPDPQKPKECKLGFDSHHYEYLYDFYYVADFESILVPSDEPGVVNRHETAGFCLHRMTSHVDYQTPPITYSGPHAIQKFFEHIFDEAEKIDYIMSNDRPMSPLSREEQIAYDTATTCQNCKSPFDSSNPKCRHHNHISGRYLFPACQKCNLALKPRWCADGYVVPCIFHNLKRYDSQFILKNFDKTYAQHANKNGTISYQDIKAIPQNSEMTLQFQIKNVVFKDSFEFLAASVDTLVSTLKKAGKENFSQTAKYLDGDDLALEKGHFPYSWFDSLDKLDEDSLPPKKAFYNDLTDEEISDRDYNHAVSVWNRYGMTKFKHFHDFYMTSDVLLLADCFESFRQSMIRAHGLDCLHFPSLPGMTLQMALKMTGVELDLITDPDQFLMIESGIRGGLSYVSRRHAKANNPSLPDYRPEEPISHLCYLDANSLYATCQTFSLPVGDFRFLSQSEIDSFDVNSISDDSPIGYALEVDLEYPAHLHADHSAYPLCPEHLTVTDDMLSPTLKEMYDYTGTTHAPSTKLISNVRDKQFYVTHYRCLKFYLTQGLKLVRIHRIISFTQRPFMRPFVEYCNRQRQNAKTDFESGLYKLLPNSLFGKTCENLRKRVNIRLVTDPKKLKRAAGKATFKRSTIINSDLVLVECARQKILMNRPLAIGFTILEMAKLVMYRFYYEALLPRYGDRLRLCFTDTDSFVFWVETPDLHADMADMLQWLDTSNFPPEHPLFSSANKRKLGYFKSETGAHSPSEFCGIRSKMYSLWTPTSDDPAHTFTKAKGVPKRYVKKHVRHEQYLHVLSHWSTTRCKYRAFRSRRHEVTTRELSKICLSCIDDKRYLLPDGVTSLPYGHRDIPV